MAGFVRGLERPETRIFWAVYEDGSTGRWETDSPEDPALDRPGRFVSEAVYTKRLRELQKAKDAMVAGLVAEDNERLRADYDALLGTGLPEATARRLSGYEPEGV